MRILIIKRGALGDVLRTTALLPVLHRRYPEASIAWLTSTGGRALLEGNPALGSVLTDAPADFARLAGMRFDWVISMEEDDACAGLEGILSPGRWTGVALRAGRLAYTEDSAPYYDMSLLNRDAGGGHRAADALKRENRRSFEEIWCSILDTGIPHRPLSPSLELAKTERAAAARIAKGLGLQRLPILIGISPGAGTRWPSKRIPERTVLELARRCRERWKAPALLLGGPDEAGRHPRLAAESNGDLIDLGTGHPIRLFAALLERCGAIATADSLTLHLGNALARPLVAAFGPTSAHEIQVVRGVRLTPPEACRCFYQSECASPRPCLGTIPAEEWIAAIERALPSAPARARRAGPFSPSSRADDRVP